MKFNSPKNMGTQMNILLVNVSNLHCILIVFVVHVERGKIETLKHAYTHIHVYMTAQCPGLVHMFKEPEILVNMSSTKRD